MKTLVTLAAALGLMGMPLVSPASAHEKPLPSAFGKELVPDQTTTERNESKAGELEDMHDKEDEEVVHSAHHAAGHGKRIHIQLDGDEDGGGDDGDGGDD